MKSRSLRRLISFAVMFVMITACFDMPVYAGESVSENAVTDTAEDAGEDFCDDILPEDEVPEEEISDEAISPEEAAALEELIVNEDADEVVYDDACETIPEEEEICGLSDEEGFNGKKKDPEPSVSSLSLISIPDKLIYRKGDDLDLTGGKVYVVYDNCTDAYLNMKAAMVSNYDKTKAGHQIVHINAGDKFVQYEVDVLNVDAGEDSLFVVADEGFPTLTKAMEWIKNDRNKTLDYEIIMFSNSLLRSLPVVTKARSLTITANTYRMEFYAVEKITFGCDTILNDLTVKCLSDYEKKTKYRTKMKIKVKKNLTLNNCDFVSSGLNIKGRDKKSVMINKSSGIYRLTGFTNTTVNGNLEIKYGLDTKRLIMNPDSRIYLSPTAKLSVTKQFTCERGAEIQLGKGFVPIDITGNMSGTVKLKSDWPAAEGDLVINLRYKDILPNFDVEGIIPRDGASYGLVKEGTEARIYGHKFMYDGTKYTNWKSVIAAINANGSKDKPAKITLLGDVDIRGHMKMPKGKKMSDLTIDGNGHELVFTGNIKLVKNTVFKKIRLKGLDDEGFVGRYYIYKKKWEIDVSDADIGLGLVR